MGILSNLTEEIKSAMRAKDSLKLEALRAIKSAVLLAQTSGSGSSELTDDEAIKLLQKLVKQRKDSAAIYLEQNRKDLALPELDEAKVISQFLPESLDDEEIEKVVVMVIEKIGAKGMKDMGKVMGLVTKEIAGRADGKTISTIVRHNLNQ